MAFRLDVEFAERDPGGRLALYRHALLKEAQAQGIPLSLRAVGSGWDEEEAAPTQATDLSTTVSFTIVTVTPSQLVLDIEDWPDKVPLGELMQFSIGERGGALYVWTRALAFERHSALIALELDAEG